MDQHPIPQDVTGFQFKLIGTMTVKQFGYVATGVIIAVILHYVPQPGVMFLIVHIILIPIVGGSGFIIAFVPIEGRPIDVMTANFVKAFLAPNQYVYRKEAKQYSFSLVALKPIVQPTTAAQSQSTSTTATQNSAATQKGKQLQEMLLHSQTEPKNALDKKEQAFLDRFSRQYISTPAAASPTVHTVSHDNLPGAPKQSQPKQVPVQKVPESPDSLEQKEEVLEKQLEEAKHTEAEAHAPPDLSAAHQKVMELEKQIQEIHIQKQMLETELSQMKTQLAQQKQTTVQITPAPQTTPALQPTPAPQAAPSTTLNEQPQTPLIPTIPEAKTAAPAVPTPSPTTSPNVRNIPQDKASSAGSPRVSDTPNVVLGIVKDSRGNVLSHILIEVKDAAGNPVRAFKTNVLGQFASATPLANGTYTIELEDPKKQHTFDKIQITAEGKIMLPIEVISHDAREELRKQLFN